MVKDEKVDDFKLHEGDGIIMLTSDPAGLYNSVSDHSEPVKDGLVEDSEKEQPDVPDDQLVENEVSEGVEPIIKRFVRNKRKQTIRTTCVLHYIRKWQS